MITAPGDPRIGPITARIASAPKSLASDWANLKMRKGGKPTVMEEIGQGVSCMIASLRGSICSCVWSQVSVHILADPLRFSKNI